MAMFAVLSANFTPINYLLTHENDMNKKTRL